MFSTICFNKHTFLMFILAFHKVVWLIRCEPWLCADALLWAGVASWRCHSDGPRLGGWQATSGPDVGPSLCLLSAPCPGKPCQVSCCSSKKLDLWIVRNVFTYCFELSDNFIKLGNLLRLCFMKVSINSSFLF